MRKITQEACEAFYQRRYFKRDNTEVYQTPEGESIMELHGNVIARYSVAKVYMTLAGWPTSTTRDRLNGLMRYITNNCRFNQHNFEQYFRDVRIESTDVVSVDASGYSDIVTYHYSTMTLN